ncbi:tyrosine-type recombinase/integrase [Acidithiobacillus ferrivorans]|uniref:tyrosine-type recombinase/integrase n=1 Tax=Acidithiobacillus ferrivorans TaxID=160808 RepID=UPI001CC16CEF|nr:tyrosine-type recombinase/integrase [Acidithiobacillus ferrivorans]
MWGFESPLSHHQVTDNFPAPLAFSLHLMLQWENIDLARQGSPAPRYQERHRPPCAIVFQSGRCAQEITRNISGKVFTRLDVSHAFIAATQKAKIEGLHFHDLRHEATSRLFEKGLNPMQVAAITGRKTLQMLKRYTHLRAEDLAKLLG